ncbi:VirB4 family type IV secretion system protein [Flintibacter porci]|uniref:VirB4 family type IV secretion system protein n=1 Tax=Flintibacter porci TaxID=3342383 RepID=UPI003F8BAB0A
MNLKNVIFGGSVTGVSDRSGAYEGSIQAWLPIKDIVQGVVVTRDKRFVKILELLPVNFYTMSSMDKSAAIEDFAAYLKIAPANLQINVLTQPFDLNGYLKLLKGYLEQETNERCRAMLEESIEYVPQLVKREALTHRFFLSFSYDPSMKAADHTPEAIAAVLNEKAEVARRYLDRCGVAVLEPEYADNFILELFYKIINKHTSQHIRLPDGVFDMLGMVHGVYDEDTLKALETEAAAPSGKKKRKLFSRNKTISPLSRLEAGATTIPDLIAPPDIDTHHADYLLLDGVYHAYLYISGYGYSTVVGKGWLTSLIEAGEGVSLSFRLVKQPREKTVNAIGQTTMINRSRMRDVGDTRQDFEELGDAIGAGLYLKEGMNREGQDFYYMHTLIEVIADDPDILEQRMTAVETLCVASDMLAKRCEYKHEQAFLSFLPLLISDPDIERKSRRNALTSGVAASFPFASYELSDQKGIFLGLNLYNRSPVFLDFYDDYKYTNGNFAGFGNTGAGKSVLLQCIGKRVREQQRKVIYIVPEKGHEYIPLCEALGGQYIKLGPSSDDSIGLMDIRRFRDDPYNARTKGLRHDSLMAEKVSWLTGWYSLNKKNLTEEDRAYIDAALIECYNNFGITFDNASVFEEDGVTPKRMPVIKDWYDVLMSKPQTEHLATVLTRYVSGSAISMGGPCNIDPDNPYTVIDLSGLPDDLMLPWVYAATGFATDIILQNGDVGTALLSDELWKLVGAHSNPLAADYTVRMVKLIRSQGGIAGVTSQGMADMMALDGGKYGKSILDSCRIKMVMQMEEQEARLIQKVLNLTEEETKMITRFHRGEGLLCIGHNHVPIAVNVSPKEYDAITTSPTDLRARMNS